MLWHVAVLCVATGRAPALCALWFMYTPRPPVLPAGLELGSGSSGWAVAPACSLAHVGSWGACLGVGLPSVPPAPVCVLVIGGFNFPLACGGLYTSQTTVGSPDFGGTTWSVARPLPRTGLRC